MTWQQHYCIRDMEPVKDKSGFDISVADAPGKIILKPGEELVLE